MKHGKISRMKVLNRKTGCELIRAISLLVERDDREIAKFLIVTITSAKPLPHVPNLHQNQEVNALVEHGNHN